MSPAVDDPSRLEPALEAESALVEQARHGDVKSFETLYRRHVGRVYAVCLRLAGERQAAEECTQDAFVQAWEALAGFRGDSAFGSWLYRIAVNVVLARHRSRIRRAAWVDTTGQDLLEQVPAPGEPVDLAMDLDRAIASLPDGARHIFVLHDVEGHRHEDIARSTGLAVGTCKAQLHRARKLLRQRLNA